MLIQNVVKERDEIWEPVFCSWFLIMILAASFKYHKTKRYFNTPIRLKFLFKLFFENDLTSLIQSIYTIGETCMKFCSWDVIW